MLDRTSLFSLLAGLALVSPVVAQSRPFISEFMADNGESLADGDGDYADWIELHNPTAAAVNLEGWYLTDAAGNLTKWRVPAVVLAPGEFRVVFASGKNRTNPAGELHTNFSLAAGGEYLALVQADGVTVAHAFGPAYPPQEEDVAFGSSFSSVPLLAAGSAGRYLVPGGAVPAAGQWTARTFNDTGWTAGASGYGYGILTAGFTVKEADSASDIASLATADALLNGVGALATDTRVRPVVNFLGDGADHHYPGNATFAMPGETHCLRATGLINIPSGAYYTFGFSSDDGGRLRIDLNGDGDFVDAQENTVVADVLRGPTDSLATVFIQAGLHAVEFVFFENYGGDEAELFAAFGSHAAWNTNFKLIGDTAAGGLTVLTPPVGSGDGSWLATNTQAAMQNVRATGYFRLPFTVADPAQLQTLSLAMRYNDGFVAWLNGVEVARRNAPAVPDWQSTATAARTVAESAVPEVINVTAGSAGLVAGTNVLAVQGLNVSAAEGAFLVQPSLTGGAVLAGGPFYFKNPTPGAMNTTPGTLGFVADTTFSHGRGLYEAPFTLTIQCATPGATIRYTTDGSKPTATTGIAVPSADALTAPVANIPVSSTTVVRAAAFKPNYDPTNVDTNTYLFLNDVIRQQSNPYGAPPPGWPVGPVNGQALNYGMDQSIVDHADPAIGGAVQVKQSLAAIPSVCITTPVASLMDAATGIYTHAIEDGFLWEREASIEMLNDTQQTAGGFQENCGIRIRGGYSRSAANPKHSFRIVFRGDYGAGKLDYPLFPWDDTAAREFDKFDIQTAQNYSWSFHGDAGNVFLREQFSRDTQLAQKSPGARGRFIHLYLNGIYWGLYQIEERPEANWTASYMGGTDVDYDVVKVETSAGYTVNPTAGDLGAWQNLWNQTRAFYNAPTLANYRRMLGQTPTGLLSPADPVLLDADNLIDYMMVVFFTGNADSPLNGSETPNNFYVARDRRGGHGFIQIQHDAEHSMDRGAGDRTGPHGDPVTGAWNNFTKSNPQFTHQDLMGNPAATDKSGAVEYKTRWGDRVYKHFYNDGVLTLAKCLERFDLRAAQVESAIRAESARWGDAQITPARNANDWRTARNALRSWLSSRHSTVIAQLQADGLFPLVATPSYNIHGGPVMANTDISLNGGGGPIYYTVNGVDPRETGGGLQPSAVLFQGGTNNATPVVVSGPAGTAWRYLDNGTDPGTAWRQPGYDDSLWKGPARGQFGYGDNDENTRIEDNPTPGYTAGDANRYITSYFRTTFEITNTNIDRLVFEIVRDDAFVLYINGVEAIRDTNLPAAPAVITASTLANGAVGGADESTFFSYTVAPGFIHAGTNTLAVEVHQNSPGSSDLSFDLRMRTEKTEFPQPIRLAGPGIVRVQARSRTAAGEWSALNDVEFLVDLQEAAAANLVIAELMYHPPAPSSEEVLAGYSAEGDFEFIELLNTGALVIDLRDCYFSAGIDYSFPNNAGAMLAPGARLILAKNAGAMALRYPRVTVFGTYGGSLDNAGETLTLKDPNGAVIKSFRYGTEAGWPAPGDGEGYSLVLRGAGTNPDPALPGQWRTSAFAGGNPGGSDAVTFAAWKAEQSIAADLGDEDQDGLSNFLEYALGSPPRVPNGNPGSGGVRPLVTGAAGDDFLTIEFASRIGAEDVEMVVETATVPGEWSASGAVLVSVVNLNDGTARQLWRSSLPESAAGRLFIRARAVLR